jgi:ABC-type nitrate/sulfonate/bicarbonate transport system permease component
MWATHFFTRASLTTNLRYPAPTIIAAGSGLEIGRAFAWRTLIAAELVFGASSGDGRAWLVHLPAQAPARQT